MHFIKYNAEKEILFCKICCTAYFMFFNTIFHHRASDILIDTPKFEFDVGNAEDDTSGVLT